MKKVALVFAITLGSFLTQARTQEHRQAGPPTERLEEQHKQKSEETIHQDQIKFDDDQRKLENKNKMRDQHDAGLSHNGKVLLGGTVIVVAGGVVGVVVAAPVVVVVAGVAGFVHIITCIE